MRSLGERCLVMIAPDWLTPERAAAEVRSHPAVTSAVPVRRYTLLGEPSAPDPYADLQAESVGLPLAALHETATGRGISVAVVDTGLDFTHPDLAGRVRRAVDFVGRQRGRFVEELHGTAVAGVLAAVAGNGIGGAGVAPGVELWALRACWHAPPGAPGAVCDSYALAQALDLVASEAPRIVNLSLTGERDELLERLIEASLARGVVVVAASAGEPLSFPASVRGVIAVRTAPRPSGPAESPPRPGSALVAPGSDLLTTTPGGGFDFVSGSSFAAAWTSGVVALLLEREPDLAPGSLGELIAMTSARAESGRRLDPCAALARLTGHAVCAGAAGPLERAAAPPDRAP
jgi:subtilisin family serine protease